MLASSFMTVLVAKVAGVEHVVACAPPRRRAAARRRSCCTRSRPPGRTRSLCLGGVQALARWPSALGGVEPVDMLVGAGNAYVAEAKRQLFGRVGIDLLAGPDRGPRDRRRDGRSRAGRRRPARPGRARPDVAGRARSRTSRDARRRPCSRHVPAPARELADRARSPAQAWRDHGEVAARADVEEAADARRRARARAPRGPRGATSTGSSSACATTARSSWATRRPSPTATRAIGTNHVLPTGRRRPLHRRSVGRQVPQDGHVPARDARGHAARRTRHRRDLATPRASPATPRRPRCGSSACSSA